MSVALHFIQSEHMLALLIAVFIFLITIVLTVKHWISFPVTLTLLLFSLAAGLLINHWQAFNQSLASSSSNKEAELIGNFHKRLLQEIEELKTEVCTNREDLLQVRNRIKEIADSIAMEKQKLQNFMEEFQGQVNHNQPLHFSPL